MSSTSTYLGREPRRSPLVSAHRRRAAPTPRCTARWSGPRRARRRRGPHARSSARLPQCCLPGPSRSKAAGDTTSAAGCVSSAAGRGRGSRAVNSPAPRVAWRQPGLFVSRARITERRFENHKVSQPRRCRIILLSLDTKNLLICRHIVITIIRHSEAHGARSRARVILTAPGVPRRRVRHRRSPVRRGAGPTMPRQFRRRR